MSTSTKDRATAVATPVVFLVASYVLTPWLMLILLPFLYFMYRKLSLNLAKEVALRLFDLVISLILIFICIGLVIAALSIVARDGQLTIPLISDGSIISICSFFANIYLTGSCLLLSVKSFHVKKHMPKLSMGIFEALRGKRVHSV